MEIWMEGYAATCEHGTAQKIFECDETDFDEAIKRLKAARPNTPTVSTMRRRNRTQR